MSGPIVFPGGTGHPDAVVRVPGSKSIANRALVCAFLADGISHLTGVPGGDDCARMLDALIAAGAVRDAADSPIEVVGGGVERLPPRIDCGLAGTTSRFLTAVAALSGHAHVIDGEAPLRRRPMGDLHGALRALGAEVVPLGEEDHLPVRAGGGRFRGGEVRVSGSTSSQFLSALLLVGPLLEEGLTIEVSTDLVSASYVAMTCDVMARFGARIGRDRSGRRWIVAGEGYRAADLSVDADHSSAAFPIAAVLLGGGRVTLPGLRRGGGQGDERILDIAVTMGAVVETTGTGVTVVHRGGPLHPIDIDMADCSDLVPAVAVACLAAEGTSRLRGVGFIRTKESNRIEDLAGQLRRLGADVRATDDGLEIAGGRPLSPTVLRTWDDHRLAMAFAVLSLRCPGLGIDEPGVVAKSWPGFLADMEPLLGGFRPAE